MSTNLLGSRRFHHPFGHAYGYMGSAKTSESELVQPRTVVELRMQALSMAIRNKDRWWDKYKDKSIRQKWIQEILAQYDNNDRDEGEGEDNGEDEDIGNVSGEDADVGDDGNDDNEDDENEDESDYDDEPYYEDKPYHHLTESMINYVLAELDDHVKIMNKTNGLQLGPFDRIWHSDSLVSSDVAERLSPAVYPLEDIPESEKDWHPNSNGQVLDLVHPSICPLVYGRTLSTKGKIFKPRLDKKIEEDMQSKRFQWLPSDFAVDTDGNVTLVSPYINNVHPIHHNKLKEVIELVLSQAAIPLWTQVLSDLRLTVPPLRISKPSCIWSLWARKQPKSRHVGLPCPEEHDNIANVFDWQMDQIDLMCLPECTPYDGDLDKFYSARPTVNLLGRTIQVVVKLANIILTPEKPKYPGGKWHVEGMNNDKIVSTFIYYYDSDNVETPSLNFCQAVAEPKQHAQDDHVCNLVLYGMVNLEACVQKVGGIATKKGRCLAFPNLYQHRVSPFSLIDPTKPGYRKILVFFLIDPTQSIPSASTVAPQQYEVFRYHLREGAKNPRSYLSRLPNEILDLIANLTESVIKRAEAEKIREELIEERKVFRENIDSSFFGHEFNMCEH